MKRFCEIALVSIFFVSCARESGPVIMYNETFDDPSLFSIQNASVTEPNSGAVGTGSGTIANGKLQLSAGAVMGVVPGAGSYICCGIAEARLLTPPTLQAGTRYIAKIAYTAGFWSSIGRQWRVIINDVPYSLRYTELNVVTYEFEFATPTEPRTLDLRFQTEGCYDGGPTGATLDIEEFTITKPGN